MLMLRSGPLDGLTVEPERGEATVVVAYQVIEGKRIVVNSPWSTVRGRPPVKGLEVELACYTGTGAFAHAGSDTICS